MKSRFFSLIMALTLLLTWLPPNILAVNAASSDSAVSQSSNEAELLLESESVTEMDMETEQLEALSAFPAPIETFDETPPASDEQNADAKSVLRDAAAKLLSDETEGVSDSGASDGISWELNTDGLLTISGEGEMKDNRWVKHREHIKTVSICGGVTSIANRAFYECVNLTQITIPEGLLSIGDYAFYGCRNLRDVVLPGGFLSIGDCAFWGCVNLQNVVLPESLGSIGNWAFSDCSALQRIVIPDEVSHIGRAPFNNCSALTSAGPIGSGSGLEFTWKQNIAEAIFGGCTGLANVVIPDGVTRIGDGMFSGCSNLESVHIPDSVASIGVGAFQGCAALTNIALPDRLTEIERLTFQNCSSLTGVTIPEGVTRIGEQAFSECEKITDARLPDGLREIGHSAFSDCVSLKSVYIPKTVTVWETESNLNSAFKGCESLETLILEDGLREIGTEAFAYCVSLKSVTLPDSLETLGAGCFLMCTSLESVRIPPSVKNWTEDGGISLWIVPGNGNYFPYENYNAAFAYCVSLKSVELCDGLESIGSRAFDNCTALSSVYVPSSVKTWQTGGGKSESYQNGAFRGCSGLTSVTLAEGITYVGDGAFERCESLSELKLPRTLTSVSGFGWCSSLKEVAIPEGVTNIGNYAFAYCSGIERLEIPKNVTSIGKSAFSGCVELKKLEIPDSVTRIDEWAFAECSGLKGVLDLTNFTSVSQYAFSHCDGITEVRFSDKLKAIGHRAFAWCASLKKVNIPATVRTWGNEYTSSSTYTYGNEAFMDCTALETLILEDGLQEIGSEAFGNCRALKQVDLPDSLTTIGAGAFVNCVSLESICIPASVKRWGNDVYAVYGYRYYGNTDYYNGAFAGCSSLKSIILSDGLTSLGSALFLDCTALTSVTIPSSVQTWEKNRRGYNSDTFAGCTGLASVTLEKGILSIGTGAFDGCRGLTSVTIPESVTSIEGEAFSGCKNLTLYVMPGSYAEEYGKEREIPFQYILNAGNLLTLTVKDSEGNPVTAGYEVRWYEKGGSIPVATGNSIWTSADSAYEYEVILDDDTLFRYRSPARTAVADSSVGTVVCVLEAIPAVTITGRVTDTDGAAIPGASVTIKQSAGSQTRSQNVTADADGNFSADALSLDTFISVAAEGYYGRQRAFSLTNTAKANLGTFQLEIVPENRFALTLTLREAAEDGQTPLETPLTATGGLSFAAYNMTRGAEIVGDLFQYPYLVIGSQAEAGDQIRIAVTDANGGVTAESVEAVYEGNPNQPLEIRFVQNGRIAATLSGDTNKRVLLFDSAGTFLRQYGAEGGAFVSDSLTAGEYRLVFIEKSSLLNSVPSLSRLAELGLAEGTDYLLSDVTVENGKITNLGTLSAPALNPERLSRMDTAGTSVTANKASVSAGQIVTVRAQYRVKDRYLTNNQRLVMELPENCNPLNGGVSVNGNSAAYSLEGRTLTVQTGVAEGTVLLMLSPEREGDYSVSCFLAFDESGENVLQPLGTAFFTAAPIQINAPSTTSKSAITVSGVTMGGASVAVYDEDTQLATTTANAAGKWFVEVELGDRYLYGVHYLHAVSETSYGARSVSDAAKVVYDANHVDATSVTVMQNGQSVVVDMEHYASKTLSYTYNPSYPSFTFLVKFTKDDAEGLGDVYVVTKSAAGEETRVPCAYQEGVGWTGAYSFSTSNLPVSVSVEYEYESNPRFFGEETLDAMREDLLIMEQASMQELEDALTAEDFVQQDETHLSIQLKLNTEDGKEDFCTYSREILDVSAFNEEEWLRNGAAGWEYEDGAKTYSMLTLEKGNLVLWYACPEKNVVWKDTAKFPERDVELQGMTEVINNMAEFTEAHPVFTYTATTALKSLSKWGAWADYGIHLWGDQRFVSVSVKNYQAMLEDDLKTIDKLIYLRCTHNVSYRLSSEQRLAYYKWEREMKGYVENYTNTVWSAFWGMKLANGIVTKKIGDFADSLPEVNPLLSFYLNFKINILDDLHRYVFSQMMPAMTATGFVEWWFNNLHNDFVQKRDEIIASYANCSHNDKDYLPVQFNDPVRIPRSLTMELLMTPIIDPSGYVCEAVPSNRLDGVTTTIYYRDPESGESVLWDAAEYDQENPLTTDAQGAYAWDVPVGQWRVKYEKPGYETVYSDWLPVPPPQTEVNVAMISESTPQLNAATVYEQEIRLEFSQYMKPETVSAEQVHVTADGTTVPGAVQPVNLEASFEDSSVSYASVYRFIPETSLEGQIEITVDAAVENYAGIAMRETANKTAFAERKPLSLSVPKNVEISAGTSQVVEVKVLPDGSGINRKIMVTSNMPSVIVAEDGITDERGIAHIPVTCSLPGSGELRFTLEGTELTAVATVNYESIPDEKDTHIEVVSVNEQEIQVTISSFDSNAMIFCAVYNNSGKMIAVRSAQITSESNYQFQFDGQQFDYAKAFIVDSDFRPLCESKRTN